MSYIALYRKWRPMVFDDVVEQEHIVKSLKYSVCNDRIAHAYLFCGTRGTGKTTMAHILSRAINCLNLHDCNPCNECDICKGILSGSILDVIEIDAASNNSVDNVREIRDDVIYSPSQTKYKVYIIDEVHMLSTGAFNALLKTLEEPPACVVFILATTEPHKLPATILSRCQRYDFRRITSSSISKHLDKIVSSSGIKVEKAALNLIARLADGALRDALSILDQCVSTESDYITYNDVLSVTGVVNETFIASFAESLNKKAINDCLIKVHTLVMEGKDISQFVLELMTYYRNLLLCNIIDDVSQIIEASQENIDIMKSQAKLLKRDFIVNIIQELSALEASLKWASQPRIMLEVSLIKICSIDLSIEQKSKFGQNLNSVASDSASNKSLSDNSVASIPTINSKLDAKEKPDTPESDSIKNSGKIEKNDAEQCNMNLDKIWQDVRNLLSSNGKRPLCICLSKGKIVPINKNSMAIIFPEQCSVNKDIASQKENHQLIENAFKTVLGRDIRIRCIVEKDEDFSFEQGADGWPNNEPSNQLGNGESQGQTNSYEDDCTNKIIDFADKYNIPVNIIDE